MENERHKLFISYSHKDAVLIDTITRRLEVEFGKSNIFYDLWSIYPGEGIIEGMNQGLEEFETFFFFVSPDSLASNMVSIEWQSALNRAIKNNLKFVPVRIADCDVPAILADKQYIDLYGEGIDSAVERMKKVIRSESVYEPSETLQNLEATAKLLDDKAIQIELRALYFSENNPEIAFACKNQIEEISVCYNVSDNFTTGYQDRIKVGEEIILNSRNVMIQRALKPGFPFVFVVYFDNTDRYNGVVLFQLINRDRREYRGIPLKLEFDANEKFELL